jgi:nitrite reductase (NO-forming)
MGTYQIPGGPAVASTEVERVLAAAGGDRRTFFKRAAALGLAVPALGGLISATGMRETAAAPTTNAGSGLQSAMRAEVQPFTVYDPFLAAVEPGPKKLSLMAQDATVYVAKDVPFAAWTFGGTIPGPVLRVVEGDEVNFTFTVAPDAATGHSVDFHSAQTAPDANYKSIMPGEDFGWSFTPKHPGAFMYHCGTPPVLMHIGSGMYGAMIVDPKEGWPPAQELVFVQSDLYLTDGENGVKAPDYTKMLGNGTMDYVVFNGYANQYVENPIQVKVGEPIRIFVVNAGPNAWSTFHVVGAIFNRAYVNANPHNVLSGLQSMAVGPGDGICVEFTLDQPGTYPAVNHAFGHAAQGAVALLQAS